MPPAPRASARTQRRELARAATRSALLTVALPSAATLGLFAVAAGANPLPAPRAEPAAVAAARPLAEASAEAAERAAAQRAQAEQTEEVARAAARLALARHEQAERMQAERQRQEAARPKFALPVAERGLSALFGEAGTHWSARHTGIDFPVEAGTPVHAATDGTVTTRWNPAYGHQATVTAPDGTETWYCHLGSYRLHTGRVHAGDVIAYSGSSGNSTGPHLHFEVRPHGEEPVDPLPWLLAHGLDPR